MCKENKMALEKVKLEEANSSALKDFGYDEITSTLIVTFPGGSEYHHYGVPVGVYNKMKEAESKGKFYSSDIKNRYLVLKVN